MDIIELISNSLAVLCMGFIFYTGYKIASKIYDHLIGKENGSVLNNFIFGLLLGMALVLSIVYLIVYFGLQGLSYPPTNIIPEFPTAML